MRKTSSNGKRRRALREQVGIWKFPVDPKNFGAQISTKNCVMEGPRPGDRLGGNLSAATFFRWIFRRYPKLSGEHISWAYNDNQVFFNWCFVTTGGRDVLRVPAMDVFCIDQGLVAYRLTEFDMNTLEVALNQAYPWPRPGVRGVRGARSIPPQEQVGISYLWTRLHQEGAPPTKLSLR